MRKRANVTQIDLITQAFSYIKIVKLGSPS